MTEGVLKARGSGPEIGSVILSAQEKTENGNKLFLLDGAEYLVKDYPLTAKAIESKYITVAATYEVEYEREHAPYNRQKSADGTRLYLWDQFGIYESFDGGHTQSLIRKFVPPEGFAGFESISIGKLTDILLCTEASSRVNLSRPKIAISTDLGKNWVVKSIDFGSITGRWNTTAIAHDESVFWVGGSHFVDGEYTFDASRSITSTDRGKTWTVPRGSGGEFNFRFTNQHHKPAFTADNARIIMAHGHPSDYISVRVDGGYAAVTGINDLGQGYYFVFSDPINNSVWIAGDNGLYNDISGNGTSWRKMPPYPARSTQDIAIDENGDMYISSTMGCYQLISGDDKWSRIFGTESLSQNISGVFLGGWDSGHPVKLYSNGKVFSTDGKLQAYSFKVPRVDLHVYGSDETALRKLVGDIIE